MLDTLPSPRAFGAGLVLCLSVLSGQALAADFIYTVRPGDHPWNLAQRYLKNPAQALALRRLNHIPDDHRIAPGTKLRIPGHWLRLEAATVRLLAVSGEAHLQQGQGAERDAQAGETLQAPVSLRTGPTGSATLLFTDGSRVLVRRDTQLRLQQAETQLLGPVGRTVMTLLSGSLENEVVPLAETGGRYEIQTPAAVAAVRGTGFRVQLSDDASSMRTEVLHGAVQVANAAGKVVVGVAQGTLASTGQAPTAPVALLPAPDLALLPELIERLPIDLPLAPQAGAVGTRTQMAPDASFVVAVSDEVSSAARIRARDVDDGRYVVRVRSIDAQGFEGLSSERVVVVHARPEPPLLIEPAADSVTSEAQPQLRWTGAANKLRYRVQLVSAKEGAAVMDRTLDDAQTQPETELTPGLYRWRLAAIDPVKGQGPWGDAQGFRRTLPGPDVEIPPVKDGQLILRWTAQPETAHYQLQVSRDAAFTTPLVDAPTEASQFNLKDLKPGEHFVRVRSVGVDGYTGAWGRAQNFVVPEMPSPSPWRALWLLLPLLGML